MIHHEKGQSLVEVMFVILLVLTGLALIFLSVKTRVNQWQGWWWSKEYRLCRKYNPQEVCKRLLSEIKKGGRFLHRLVMPSSAQKIYDTYSELQKAQSDIHEAYETIQYQLKSIKNDFESFKDRLDPKSQNILNKEIQEMTSILQNVEKELKNFGYQKEIKNY